jgi:DNA-binding transcriptional LysR family regulator
LHKCCEQAQDGKVVMQDCKMDWDDLRVFLAVARGESLTAAGRALRIDPATVGRRVARLEGVMGAALFAKSQTGYVLTEDGARLMDHAEAAEAAMVGAAEALQGTQGLTGQIRIGAPDGCANYLLPQVLTAICDANPGLEVQIVALPRVFNLSKREADMAVAVSRPETGRVTAQKITDYRLHLAASADYLGRCGTPMARADLRGHRLIGYIPDMIFDKELDYMAEVGLGAVPLASNSVSVQLNWLRAGAGIGVVHDFALPAAPELRRVLVEEVSLTRAFWLIRHEGDRRLERLNRFAGLLMAGLRAEVARLEAMADTQP